MTYESRPCQRCGREIPAERIEALPETELCIPCSEAVGTDFQLFATPITTSKVGGMKKNYGGWTIGKRRRVIMPIARPDEG